MLMLKRAQVAARLGDYDRVVAADVRRRGEFAEKGERRRKPLASPPWRGLFRRGKV